QKELVKDYQVTAPVVDRLGWLGDPGRIAAYQARPPGDNRDFRRWLAAQVADRTKAALDSGTIFEISFSSASPVEAKIGAETLRDAFVNYSLSTKRAEAARNAQWYAQQAEAARNLADQAQAATAAYEKANGIVMEGDSESARRDTNNARLSALVAQAAN